MTREPPGRRRDGTVSKPPCPISLSGEFLHKTGAAADIRFGAPLIALISSHAHNASH